MRVEAIRLTAILAVVGVILLMGLTMFSDNQSTEREKMSEPTAEKFMDSALPLDNKVTFQELKALKEKQQKNKNNLVKKAKQEPVKEKVKEETKKIEEQKDAEKVKVEEKKAAEKVKVEEKKTAEKVKVEEKKAAEKVKVEEKKVAEKVKVEEKKAAEKVKVEEKKTAEKAKVEEKKLDVEEKIEKLVEENREYEEKKKAERAKVEEKKLPGEKENKKTEKEKKKKAEKVRVEEKKSVQKKEENKKSEEKKNSEQKQVEISSKEVKKFEKDVKEFEKELKGLEEELAQEENELLNKESKEKKEKKFNEKTQTHHDHNNDEKKQIEKKVEKNQEKKVEEKKEVKNEKQQVNKNNDEKQVEKTDEKKQEKKVDEKKEAKKENTQVNENDKKKQVEKADEKKHEKKVDEKKESKKVDNKKEVKNVDEKKEAKKIDEKKEEKNKVKHVAGDHLTHVSKKELNHFEDEMKQLEKELKEFEEEMAKRKLSKAEKEDNQKKVENSKQSVPQPEQVKIATREAKVDEKKHNPNILDKLKDLSLKPHQIKKFKAEEPGKIEKIVLENIENEKCWRTFIDAKKTEITKMEEATPHKFRTPEIQKICRIEEADFCKKRTNMDTLVAVTSQLNHLEERNFIRGTWGKESNKIGVVFMVGSNHQDEKSMQKLKEESDKYHDIVQGNYDDKFEYLSYKTMSSLYWVSELCNNAKYIVYVDDDVLLNTNNLLKYLSGLEKKSKITQDSFHCLTMDGTPVMRDTETLHPYFKSYESIKFTYPCDTYPRHCLASGWITSKNSVKSLLKAAEEVKFLSMENMFVTGILPNYLNMNHVNANFKMSPPVEYNNVDKTLLYLNVHSNRVEEYEKVKSFYEHNPQLKFKPA